MSSRIYVSDDNHKFLSNLVEGLKGIESIKRLQVRVDQNLAFDVLRIASGIDFENKESIEDAYSRYMESLKQ